MTKIILQNHLPSRGFTILSVYLLLLSLLAVQGCSSEAHEVDLPNYSVDYDPSRDPFADGRAAIALASASDRRILIEVGGNWCPWCRALAGLPVNDTDIRQQLHKNFVVLKVNYSDENDNAAFLSTLPENQGYPHLYISEQDGTVIHSQDTAELLDDGRYSKEKYLRFLERWKKS